MRLKTLILEGFKSYKEQVVIDFKKIPLNDLFLIQGKTGAGKSSILDAIIFALYGSSKDEYINFITNSIREEIENNPQKYKGKVITRVELDFEYFNNHYKIIRKIVPKLSKNLVNYNLDSEYFLENSKIPAVPEFIRKIDRDQFTKSIIIPQNRFDQFLKSTVSEKEKILKEIFRTNKYDEFINFIDDLLKKSKDSQESIGMELKSILFQSEISKSIEDDAIFFEFEDKIKSYEKEIEHILKEKNEKEIKKRILEKQTKELQDQISYLNEYKMILQEDIQHRQKEKEIQYLNLRLENAKKVVDLYPLYEVIKKLDNDIKNREGQLKQNIILLKQKENFLKEKMKEKQLLEEKKEDIEKQKLELKEKEHIFPKIDIYLKVKNELNEEYTNKEKEEKELNKIHKQLDNIQNRIEEIYKSYFSKQLKEHEPCPICGSTEHPKPFQSTLDEDPEILLEQKKALESQKQDIEKSLKTISNQISRKEKEIQSIVEFLERKQYDLKESRNIKQFLQTEILNHKKAIKEYETKLKHLEKEVLKLQEEKNLLAGKIHESEKILEQNKKDLQENQKKFNKILLERKLEVSQIPQFYLDESQRLQLERQIQNYFNKKIELETKLHQIYEKIQTILKEKDSQINDIQDKILTLQNEVLLKEEEIQNLQKTLETYQQTLGKLEEHLKRLKLLYEKFKSTYEFYKQKLREIRLIETINTLISDRNPKNLSFHRYIIQVYFEIVMEYANQRLKKINPRYILKASEERETTRKHKAGLNIKILDTYQGERDVKSLSGGETFYVSLALALGLYDIIHSKFSDLHFDFLFIDEGFGSLDEETLQNVLSMIKDIFINEHKNSYKQIGLISHVESMKYQIPHQIIITNQNGISYVQIKI